MQGDGGEAGEDEDAAATLTVGPTTEGMVRLMIEGADVALPMDFDPDEAEEIADELRAAAAQARLTRERRMSRPDLRRRR